ncbi:MAG: 30S ribosomal protein S9 [Planctomycetes bacterium]|nr:30S ribosomal protein S9 [Planctomycetota bacterium]
MLQDVLYIRGVGRRKTSVARVWMKKGTGKITVNGLEYDKYFNSIQQVNDILAPLQVTKTVSKYDIFCNVNGGGKSGQAGAITLGISRALKNVEPTWEPKLRESGFLTRDSRMKERKKYGLHGARRGVQFSKR